MNQKETLIPYVTSQLKAGTPAETIKQRLIEQGWTANIVDEVIADVANSVQPAELPASVLLPESREPAVAALNEARTPADTNYTVRRAFRDAFTAIRNNSLAIGIMILIGLVATGVLYVIFIAAGIASVLGLGFTTAIFSKNIGVPQLVVTVVVLVVVAAVVSSLVSAFTTSITNLAINDGADNKKSDIKQTLVTGLKRTLRVALATLLSVLIVTSPILLIGLLGLIMVVAIPGLAIVALLLALVAFPITLLLALRLILVPTIALFEPATPLRQLYGRSRDLMKNGGNWFIIKIFVVYFILALIMSIFTAQVNLAAKSPGGASTFIIIVLTSLVQLAYAAVIVSFYRNRKAVKG